MSFEVKLISVIFKVFIFSRVIKFAAMWVTFIVVNQLVGFIIDNENVVLIVSLLAGVIVFYYLMIPKLLRDAIFRRLK